MIATGSLCAIHGSTIGDSENSAIVILIVDASSVKCGNLAGAILIADGNSTAGGILIAGVGSGRIGAAILTAARRIGDVAMVAAKAVGVEEGKSKVD
jgi:hypothetical protein